MAERRKYIDVQIPIIGSTMRLLGTVENLHDMTIRLDMTRKMRGKGLTMTFRIINVEGKLYAFPNKMELVKSYIRRMMRKRTDYVEDSFTVRCSDTKAIMKPLLITRKRVSRAVRKNLRNTTKEFLVEYAKDREYNDICKELMDGVLQKTLLPKLKKVYPLSFCDLRVFETKEIGNVDINKIIEEASKKKIEILDEETDGQENYEESEEGEESDLEDEESVEEESREKDD